jgi:hypothetical protein
MLKLRDIILQYKNFYSALHFYKERDLILEIPVNSQSCNGIKYYLASKMDAYGSLQCLYNLELL